VPILRNFEDTFGEMISYFEGRCRSNKDDYFFQFHLKSSSTRGKVVIGMSYVERRGK